MTTSASATASEISPFHAGEQCVQDRLGVREEIEPWARQVVRGFLTEQHREFYAALPFVVAAARDDNGQPWATLLAGAPGFMHAPDPTVLRIAAQPAAGDALAGALVPGRDVGLLGIEFGTRRRNRVNGRLGRMAGSQTGDDTSPGDLALEVGQAFGNCPQHIVTRDWEMAPHTRASAPTRDAATLDATARALIARADTCFLASGHSGDPASAASGMDASHRGGPAGFVEVIDERHLRLPDYSGNNHFNTLGNLVLDPRIGLLFVDFERGDLVQVAGIATIDFAPDVADDAVRRVIDIRVERVVRQERALPLRFRPRPAAALPLRLLERVDESADVTSFRFGSASTAPLPPFIAGQHLPIVIDRGTDAPPLRRTYSLSGDPGATTYRLSVKREADGVASSWLHDRLRPGAVIQAQAPAGDFVLPASGGGSLFLAAGGIGITPFAAMLSALDARADAPPVTLLHVVRDGAHHPLATEIRALFARRRDWHLHVAYTRPRTGDAPDVDYDSAGRFDAAALSSLPNAHAGVDAYLCGPAGFMSAIGELLRSAGVPDQHIHTEQF